VAFSRKPFFQLQIVFDDAVVNHDDLSRTVAVRVRIFLSRSSVRRPPRMPDAIRPVKRLEPDRFLKIPQLPFGSTQFKMLILINNRDARRIVSAILQLPKPVNYQRHNLFISNVSNNSTHIILL
jgi:hypothetical protein